MLTHLSIRNIVLIEACDLAFENGLCVLTGETGAGKSILLDSLGLALGARADSALVRHGEASGQVTAEFDVRAQARVAAAMAELELEPADTLVIRRSIHADGRARALVNDQPVSVTALRRLGETLVEIHGQHDSHGLMDSSTHRALLDEFGRHDAMLADVREAHQHWRQAENRLEELREKVEQSRREEEYLRHMEAELSTLAPGTGEEDELATARTTMMQSEKLFETLSDALKELQGNKGVSMTLRSAQRTLMRSTLNADNRFAPAIDALERAATEADEAEIALEALARAAVYDPKKLEQIEERLFALKAAARKYGTSADGLAELLASAQARLALISSEDKEMSLLEAQAAQAKDAFTASARLLTKKREQAAKKLKAAIEAELEPLKMGSARFQVRLEPLAENAWGVHGMDAVSFEAATNVGKKGDMPFSPLAKIASGGELSRFMLAMKVGLSELRSTPTLVFDEIDTGTGGSVADAIGARLARLGERTQVLVVTHLPQVAARGSQHLQVRKEEVKGHIKTSVTALNAAERREELARMLAGSTVTPEARKAAAKLLEQAE